MIREKTAYAGVCFFFSFRLKDRRVSLEVKKREEKVKEEEES